MRIWQIALVLTWAVIDCSDVAAQSPRKGAVIKIADTAMAPTIRLSDGLTLAPGLPAPPVRMVITNEPANFKISDLKIIPLESPKITNNPMFFDQPKFESGTENFGPLANCTVTNFKFFFDVTRYPFRATRNSKWLKK